MAWVGALIAYGAMNADEGFYAAAARAVWEGEVPYRDFGYTQTPLLPYVNGVVLGLTRFGLFEQRALNGLWGLLALLLGAELLRRRGHPGRGLLLLLVFALTPGWMYLSNLGKTYGFVALVVMASAWVLLEWSPGWRKSTALSVLAVVGVGCRLPAAPFFAIVWLAGLREADGFSARRLAHAVGSLVAATGLLLAPFHLLAPEQARFWLLDFHRVSVPLRTWHVRWEEIVALSPAAWGLLAVAVAAGLAARRTWPWRECALLVAALVALGANVLPRGAYEEYGVPFLPPLALAGFLLLPTLGARLRWAGVAAVVVLPLVIVPPLCFPYRGPTKAAFPSGYLPLNTRPYNYALPRDIREGRELVRAHLPAGEPFYGPAIILAIEADRPIPRRLRMGAFTMTSDFPEPKANALHLMTYTELARLAVSSPLRVLGLHAQPVFNYAWSVPSFSFQTDAERARWGATISPRFKVARTDADFVILVSRY